MKFAAVFASLVCFMVICGSFYVAGFLMLGENDFGKEFVLFLLLQLLMNVEVAAICFVISAISRKNRLGVGIAVAMLLYLYDLMARVVPDLKDVIFLSPFSYANATSVFSNADMDTTALALGTIMIVVMTGLAGFIYARRDLAS